MTPAIHAPRPARWWVTLLAEEQLVSEVAAIVSLARRAA